MPLTPNKAADIRAKLGYSMTRAAVVAGLSGPQILKRVENGETGIQVETLMRVALAYGCAPVELWPQLGAKPKQAQASNPRAYKPRRGPKSLNPAIRGDPDDG